MSDGEVDDIRAAKEKLMTDSQSLFQKVYEQAQAAGGQGAGPDMNAGGFTQGAGPDMYSNGGFNGSQSNNGKDDGIVDADYKEV